MQQYQTDASVLACFRARIFVDTFLLSHADSKHLCRLRRTTSSAME